MTAEVKGIVDDRYWSAAADLARLIGVLSDGFRRKGDTEELEKLLDETSVYIRQTIEKLREVKDDRS